MPSYCQYTNCINKNGKRKEATYGYSDTKKRIYCATHKKDDMINLKKDHRKCPHPDHKNDKKPIRPSFNFPGEKKGLYCQSHAEPGMVNVNNSVKCTSCKKVQPSFGLSGKKPTHCAKCKENGMVDLVSNLCEICKRINATYGFPGEKATHCKKDSLDGMIDVKNAKCVVCLEFKVHDPNYKPKQPTFGFNKPTHCHKHKTNEMVDCKHSSAYCKLCPKKNCKRATYGKVGTTKPLYCAEHKQKNTVDVISNMCVKCKMVQGVYGYNKKELFCVACKEPEMKNVMGNMCENCKEHQASFNFEGETKGRFCSACKDDKMDDVVNPRCKSCGIFVVNGKSSKLCSYCDPNSKLRKKTKEMKIVNFLTENKFNFIHNKSVGKVCGAYRPDIKIDVGTHLVIVEVDEDQHKQYDLTCEAARMFNIYQAEGLRCVFLRYNPDKYRDNKSTLRIPLCERLRLLKQHIKKHMKKVPKDEVTVYRMFYDNDEGEFVQKYDYTEDLKQFQKTN